MLHGSVSTGLGDSEVSSSWSFLVPISTTALAGIAVFLAAHACVTRGGKSSEELALAAVSHLRKGSLAAGIPARLARSLGRSAALSGLGSIVYALALVSKLTCIHDALLADAPVGAALVHGRSHCVRTSNWMS